MKNKMCELAGGLTLPLGKRTLIMGILNATPDSFSDGGRYNSVEAALQHARELVAAGADIIDVGGESTRPGAVYVSVDEEIERVVPVIEALKKELPHTPLSIDTYKAQTARYAVEAGAHIINDVWGLRWGDRDMASVAAALGCPIIISHNRETAEYQDVVLDVCSDLQDSVELAQAAGVLSENIWLDPGIGFAKSYEENLLLLGQMKRLAAMGYPILLGTSRKRVIKESLRLAALAKGEDEETAIEPLAVELGTGATLALGIAGGCDIVRVHDVQTLKHIIRMTDAVVRVGQREG